MNIPELPMKQLAAAILISAPIFGAQAALVDLNLTASSSASVDGGPAVTDSQGPLPTSVFSNSNDSSGPSYAFATSTGDNDGSFYSNASGGGTYASSATFLQSYTVANDPFEQFFDFTFTIVNGSLSVCDGEGHGDELCGFGFNEEVFGPASFSPTLPGEATAAYQAEIRLNNNVIWNSMAELVHTGTGTTLTSSGEMLGTYFPSSSYYSWSPQTYTLDLGTFAEGEVFTLDYEITLSTSGIESGSHAQFGDPNGFGQGGSPFTATSVPEPGSLGIVAAGLGLLGISRRKRKDRA